MFRFLFQPRSLFIFIFIMATMVILVGIVSFFPPARPGHTPLSHPVYERYQSRLADFMAL